MERSREIAARFRRSGFAFKPQAAGSHEIWFNPATGRHTTIPNTRETCLKGPCGPSSGSQELILMTF
jgi:hypothetical protein